MNRIQHYFIDRPCENNVLFHARLNSEANIGQQPAGQTPPWHGNIWVDSARYNSGYGAVNINAVPTQNLLLSLFTTHSGIPNHNPVIPFNNILGPFYVNDQGWFSPQIDTITFNCDSSSICPTYEFSGGGEEYRQMVAENNAVSSVFIPESKVISQQLLYRELKEDSALLSTNLLYDDFVNEKEVESVGRLYEVEREMKGASAGDSSLSSDLIASNNLIKLYGDSIRYMDSLMLDNPTTILQQQKENIISLIGVQRSILNVFGSQLKANDNVRITSALSKNNALQPSQLPDANEKYINDVTFRYKVHGLSVLLNEYEPVLQIALQCPYSGGPSIYQARVLIRLINDTIENNDEDVCAMLGIFRVQNVRSKSTFKELKIFPNPSNGNVMLVFSGMIGNDIHLKINDVLGRRVIGRIISNLTNTYQLQLPNLQNGIYSLMLSDKQGNHLTEKLIITK